MKAKVELTAETVRKAIEEGKFSSLTGLAHSLGYKGSVSSTLTRKLRALVPDIDAMLKANAAPVEGKEKGDAGKTGPTGTKAKKATNKAAKGKGKAKPAAKSAVKGGKWPNDPRNPFVRPSSAYHVAFNILAAHPAGLPREKLVEHLAAATGKDLKHAGYDAQVLLSAHGNSDEPGLSRNDGPRHRSCRPGFWVKRENGHVTLMVD